MSDRAFARFASYVGFRASESAEARSAKAEAKPGEYVRRRTGVPDFAEPVLGLAEGETRGLNPGYELGAQPNGLLSVTGAE